MRRIVNRAGRTAEAEVDFADDIWTVKVGDAAFSNFDYEAALDRAYDAGGAETMLYRHTDAARDRCKELGI